MTMRRFSLCLLCGLLAALLLTGCPKRGTDYEKNSTDTPTTSDSSTPQGAGDTDGSQGSSATDNSGNGSKVTPDSKPSGATVGQTDGELDLENEKDSTGTNTPGGTAGDNKTPSGQKPAGDAGSTTTTPQTPGTTTRPNTGADLENRSNWKYVTF